MPTYTCEKCARMFKQKSHYQDHLDKKIDCSETSAIAPLVEEIKEIKKEIKEMKDIQGELILPDSIEERKKVISAYIEDLHNILWNRSGLNPEKALEHMTFFFAYRLIEVQVEHLGLPKECCWGYISSLKSANDMFETIKKGVTAFRKCPQTKPFFKPHEIQKADLVYDIVKMISRIPVRALQETDTLGDIFEYMLGRGMSTMASEGQYYTMRQLCEMAARLAIRIRQGRLRRDDGTLCTFADWFCGTGGFPAAYVKAVNNELKNSVVWSNDSKSIYCQDMNVSSVTTTLLNMLILTGVPFSNDTIRSGNSFTEPITRGNAAPFPGVKIDYCFMNPPYGGDNGKHGFKYSKSVGTGKKKETQYLVNQDIQAIGIQEHSKVSAGVQLAMSTLSEDGGVCCLVLPQGFFFSATQSTIELRKKIAEEYKIHYVIDVASGSFINTTTKTSMLIFQKGVGATDTVSFIGLDEKVLVETTLEELRAKNYSLNYKQYLPQSAVEVDGFEMVKLGDVLEKKSSGKTKVGDISNTGEYPFFSCKIDNPCGTHSSYDHEETEYLLFAKSGGNSKQPTGNNLGIGRFYYMTEKSASTSDVSKFVLKNQSINLKYVSIVLHTKLYQIQSLAKYTTGLGHIDIDQMFDEIQIPLPSLEKQREIVEQIDFYTQLAHAEEQSLKILEKIVMGWVKEMGRGKERVKLESILKNVKYPKHPTEYGNECGKFRFHTGAESTKLYTDKPDIDDLVIIVNRTNGSGKCHIFIDNNCSVATQTITFSSTNDITTVFLYYYFKSDISILEAGYQGACHKNLTTQYINDIQIPLPSLAEQQTLQSDFDEIRHKHAKIAEYKAKAQEAIQRLIPGASSSSSTNTSSDGKQEASAVSNTDSDDEKQDVVTDSCAMPASSSSVPSPNYSKMKLDELKALCKERNIKGFSRKNKDDLMKMLEKIS